MLRNSKERTIRLAPLFDHGLSLLFQCHNISEIESFHVLEDRPIQCFVGSHSAEKNLISSAEAAEILGCSRQYIEKLIDQDKLHPIKRLPKSTLLLKAEVMSFL